MNLRNMTIASMIIVTQNWLDPAGLLPVLEAHESLRIFVPKLRKRLEELLRLRPLQDTVEKLLKDVGLSARATDRRHDAKARALFLALESLINGFYEDEPDLCESCRVLQEALFPSQLKILNLSYLEEVGEAMRVAEQLSEAHQQLLQAVAWGKPGQTLWDLFAGWQAAAADLNALEARREVLLSERPHAAGDGVTAAQIQSERQLWGRTVRSFLSMIELEEDLSPAQRDQLKARLQRFAEVVASDPSDSP